MNHFGPLLENADIEIITRANAICNEMGMDTISAGATLACYAEIENKRLTGDEILSLLTAVANGSGIGKELGKGSFFINKEIALEVLTEQTKEYATEQA